MSGIDHIQWRIDDIEERITTLEGQAAVMIRLRVALDPTSHGAMRETYSLRIDAAAHEIGELRGKLRELIGRDSEDMLDA